MTGKKDITGEAPELRERAEEALRESEARLRAILKTAMDGFWRVDLQGRLLEVNDAYCRMSGYGEQELLAMRISDLEVAETSADIDAHMQSIRAQGENRFESRHRRKDGSIFEVEICVQYRPEEYGYMVAFLKDITEHKRIMTALFRAKAEWEHTFDVVPDLIALIDRDHRIIRVNRAMAARMGSEPRQLVGSTCFEAVHGLSAPPDFCPHAKLLISGKEERAEVAEKRLDGIFDVTTSPLCDEAGRIMGSVHVARDITEHKMEEEELRVFNEQLRALATRLQTVREEERTRIARDIHDVLAQELTRLKIDLIWLHRWLPNYPGKATTVEALATRIAEMIQVADAAIQCVQRIATDLRPAVLDSLGLCAAVEWQTRDFQDHSGISCNTSVSDEELPIGGNAATAVFRILQESLTNVQRHANATRLDIVLRQEAEQLLLRIHDNGCGIRAETLSSPMSIGLTGMKERALLLGGQFEIRSQPETGTTVEVRMPLVKNEGSFSDRAGSSIGNT